MKRLIAIILLASSPVHATWTHVQTVCNAACTTSSASCAVTVSATGSGNLLVGYENCDGGANCNTDQLSSASGAGTWTHCSGCFSGGNGRGNDIIYNTNSTSGVTSITLTMASVPSGSWQACVKEFSSSTGGIALDTGAAPVCSGSRASQTPDGCALTLSGANSVIVSGMAWGGSLSGVTAPYANASFPNSNGVASWINTTAGTAVSWTPTTVNTGRSTSIGFKENAAGGSAPVGSSKQSRSRRYE